jgi:hypothetical protein
MTETRYQRIAREQRERQEARAKAAAKSTRRRRKGTTYSAEQRIADRIDGYDRDDLGYSPDY